MAQVFVNLGYALMLLALMVRDILWLRGILVAAQFSLAIYAFVTASTSVMFWNSLFVIINAVQIVRILRERRPVRIPPDVIDLYENVCSLMSPRAFLDFWHMGVMHTVQDDVIIRKDEPQKELSLILSGTVVVMKEGRVISQISRGSFIAEMSFFTGNVASADVMAKGRVQYIAWRQDGLDSLKRSNPPLFIKIQGVLGKDLIEKIHATSAS
jgi:CRP-like cAMP-binding protein